MGNTYACTVVKIVYIQDHMVQGGCVYMKRIRKGDIRMNEKYYYKITSEDGTELYTSVSAYVEPNVLCEILGLGNYTAVEITKEEYDENTED